MNASPMRPWQNLLALLATMFAGIALLPVAPHVRLLCSVLAISVICVMLAVRLRAHGARRSERRVDDVYGRIDRIRSQRRGGRRR